jgi:hypothetical protein
VLANALLEWLKDGLRFSRLPSGAILIKYEWVDQFLESFKYNENQVDKTDLP